jgi:hypothetical protein
VTLIAELEEFVGEHRQHGRLSGDATAPAWNGYRLRVACSCGVTFERWITPWDAELDLLRVAGASEDHRKWRQHETTVDPTQFGRARTEATRNGH